MTILLILGLVLLASGVAMAMRALTVGPSNAGGVVQQIERYGFGYLDQEVEEQTRPLDRIAVGIGQYLGKRLSWFDEQQLRVRLVAAGMYSTTPARFLGYQALLALAFLLLAIWMADVRNASPVATVIGAVAATAVGWFLLMLLLVLRIRRRREAIEYELPELIDLLIVAVEAGMSLSGALRISSSEIRGALGEELRLTLQEQNMGLSTTETLQNLVVRADTPGMRIFVRSIVQGENLGISIGQVMRSLALEMRKRRKAAAEERARKAPVKMIFPLVLLIFPAMFVVLLLPALLTIADVLS